jgi:hypothetical protein
MATHEPRSSQRSFRLSGSTSGLLDDLAYETLLDQPMKANPDDRAFIDRIHWL